MSETIVEFCGVLSDKVIEEVVELRRKAMIKLWIFVDIAVFCLLSIEGFFRGKWLPVILIELIVVLLGIFITFPIKRKSPLRLFSTKFMIDKEFVYFSSLNGVDGFSKRKIKNIKKVIDYGDWYCLIFKYGDVTNSFICQKDLIVKGTLSDFETLFLDYIVRMIKE